VHRAGHRGRDLREAVGANPHGEENARSACVSNHEARVMKRPLPSWFETRGLCRTPHHEGRDHKFI
jgi:hypothetical protein